MKTVGELLNAIDELKEVNKQIALLESRRDALAKSINEAIGRDKKALSR